jgi:bla regulator protein BlaR1
MPAILIYLLKVNIALLLFCLCYYVILRRLTFYTLNRVYLITAILFSTLYPLIDFTSIMQRNQKLVQPIQVAVINLNLRAAKFARPVAQTNYWAWLVALFWIGVVVMALRLIMQFISLLRIYRRSKPALINSYKVRVIADEANPFSFWQSIYINPHHHGADELQSIIAHEQVHVSQWHTLDILLAEISLVFYWFNPGVWLMKKAIAENLEFITDRKILQQGVDAKSYQYSLLYASFNTSPNAMVNHFNISTIKKRIMMMNSKRSSAYSLSRYGLIAPAILALVLVFGTTKAELLKKGAHEVKKATEKAITAVNLTLKNIPVNPKAVILTSKIKESAANLTTYVLKASKPDTTIKLTGVSFTTDTPKYKPAVKMHFTGPDSGYYVIDGKPVTASQMTNINPNDIVSINIVSELNSRKIFGNGANKGGVLIVTKAGENSEAVKNLMKQISELKGTASAKQTGIYNITPPKGSLNSITIMNTKDSSKLGGSITVTGSASYTANGKNDHSLNKVNVSSVEYMRRYPKTYFDSVSQNRKPIAGIVTKHDITINDITRGWGIKQDITAKNIFDEQPGIIIKGISGVNDPLYIIDGKPAEVTVIKSLKASAIERIDVLKDASATSIYGEKGKNGVVIVTTKEAAKANTTKPAGSKN